MGPAVDQTRFYTDAYSQADADAAQGYGDWRALGARTKADHVEALLAKAGLWPGHVVEIGGGAGSLVAELAARGVAPRFDGFDLSEPAIDIARDHEIAGASFAAFDGECVPAADGAYDLAVLSHVLEHVPDPAALLAEAARVAPLVLVEVPLEDNRSAARPAKRAEAARIGHIQFFDRAAIRALVRGAGLEIRAELADPLLLAHHAFGAAGAKARARVALKAGVRRVAWRIAPRAAERAFTVHYACLAAGA
jgi:SAM-dependent methyltransferase